MKVIRFHYNYGRAEIFLPRVKITPGMEGWVEIQGLVDYTVSGIKGSMNGNRFMLSQVEDDVIITVDGVCHKILKEELRPDIKTEEIIIPEFNYGSGADYEEIKEDLIEYIDEKFQNEGLTQIVEEKASEVVAPLVKETAEEVVENLVADATEEDIRNIFSQPIINSNEG